MMRSLEKHVKLHSAKIDGDGDVMTNIDSDFERSVTLLTGKPCWGVSAGRGTGSRFVLDLGATVRRAHPVRNPHLMKKQQEYQGELSLFVVCAWRLDSATRVICGWKDSNAPDGAMTRGLRALVGRTVESVLVYKPGYDLVIDFRGYSLEIFCDCTSGSAEDSNYTLSSWKQIPTGQWRGVGYTVNCSAKIQKEVLPGSPTYGAIRGS